MSEQEGIRAQLQRRLDMRSRAEKALDVWASVVHARGGGSRTMPKVTECFELVLDAPDDSGRRDGVMVKKCLDSANMYDATEGKYEHLPKMTVELSTMSEFEVVERTIRRMETPAIAVVYALHRHPAFGRYAPPDSLGVYEDEREAVVEFLRRPGIQVEMLGKHTTRRAEEGARRLVQSLYHNLCWAVKQTIHGDVSNQKRRSA